MGTNNKEPDNDRGSKLGSSRLLGFRAASLGFVAALTDQAARAFFLKL